MKTRNIVYDLIDLAMTVIGLTLIMVFGFEKNLLSFLASVLGLTLVRYAPIIVINGKHKGR